MCCTTLRGAVRVGVLAALVAGASNIANGRPGTIVSLDESRTGNSNTSGLTDFYLTSSSMATATAVLTSAGFGVTTTDAFTAQSLLGATIAYTGLMDVDCTAQEIATLQSFVFGGGGLVITRDWGPYYPAVDPLLSAFGVTCGPEPQGLRGTPTPVLDTTAGQHAIWNGPAGTAASFLQVYSASIVGGTAVVGRHEVEGTAALGVVTYGAGKVVVLTDSGAWVDSSYALMKEGSNNVVVWENIFHYADVPGPATAVLAGAGAMLIGRRRR